ncbi:MAG: GNAT family N-acetyltransferase [Ignavibacteriaceae bacterium]|nr:GNAT family N-acetyltransferase [Ignavibacteriaceae bacterium]
MDDLIISNDKSKLDIGLIYKFLTSSYWAEGRTFDEVKNSIENSICFGVYKDNRQIGFARVVSDLTVIAYLMDVFIIEKYRGKGFSKLLLNRIFEDQKFSRVKKWMLATKDAHSLYAEFGFEEIKNSDRLMEKVVLRK